MLRNKAWLAYQQLLKHTDLPILVGPWRGEVGFEALYWIPFVRRLAKRLNITPDRLIPITRGGAAPWYGMADGVELYALRTPQDVRVENRIQHAKYRMLKQTRWTPFDRGVVADAATQLGLKRYLTLHPAWMYARISPFFEGAMSLHDLEQEALFDAIQPAPVTLQLPERFVAVRFYVRYTFPGHPPLVQFAQESIKTIAAHTPVVLLNAGIHVDDHVDILMKPHPNVVRMTDLCEVTPQNNLAVQSAILGKALGFVGTYGGLAQLALRIGKPSVSYYHEWGGTAMAHKHLADALALGHGLPCQVHKVGELPLLQSVVPTMQLTAQ